MASALFFRKIRPDMALAVKAMTMEKSADQMQVDLLAKTGMLVEALPFMRRYSG